MANIGDPEDDDANFIRSLVGFFSHFAATGYPGIPALSNSGDPLGMELLARHPNFPKRITAEGLIPVMMDLIDGAISPVETASFVRHEISSDPFISDIPQTPVMPTESESGFADLPGIRELFHLASSSFLKSFDFSKAVKSKNLKRGKTDRPTIPSSTIMTSAELLFGIHFLGSIWYYYATPSSFEPVMTHWCSWFSDRVDGARAIALSIPITEYPVSAQSLFTVDAEIDILATMWTFASRSVGNIQPTGYQVTFAEFYSLIALRSGFGLVACDGTPVVDVAAVAQTTSQIPTLGYDRATGDQRGGSIFWKDKLGRDWAARYAAAVRWYIQCSPSAVGLGIMGCGLYAWSSKRHGPGYWNYTRPRLLQARIEHSRGHPSSFEMPVCNPGFWYDGALEGHPPPPLHRCSHHSPPVYESPIVDTINALMSITECETYEEWRTKVDAPVARMGSWLQELATHEKSDLLHATAGAAPSFLKLLSSVLTAELEYD